MKSWTVWPANYRCLTKIIQRHGACCSVMCEQFVTLDFLYHFYAIMVLTLWLMMYSILIHEESGACMQPCWVCKSRCTSLELPACDAFLCFHDATDSRWGLTKRGGLGASSAIGWHRRGHSGLIKSPHGQGTGAVEWIVLLRSRVSHGPNGVLVWLGPDKPHSATSDCELIC